LQKRRFFIGACVRIFAFRSTLEGSQMTTFWQSLAQIAHGQLFLGGHLSAAAVTRLTHRVEAPCDGKRGKIHRDHLPWPRLAIPH
jgi:hypothetical protein